MNQFNHKCYKTKDDRHGYSTLVGFKNIPRTQWEQIFGTEEERQEKLKAWREKCRNNKVDNNSDCPNISIWNPEWTFLATGQRLTKRQLKDYCKQNNKGIE